MKYTAFVTEDDTKQEADVKRSLKRQMTSLFESKKKKPTYDFPENDLVFEYNSNFYKKKEVVDSEKRSPILDNLLMLQSMQ